MSFRTTITQGQYDRDRQEGKTKSLLDEPPLMDFKYWKVITNAYPHDRIADAHDMLILKRECSKLWRINVFELIELRTILEALNYQYDTVTFNLASVQSVKTIPHFHLYQLKKMYK